MKQHITSEQWEELDLRQQNIMDKSVGHIIFEYDKKTQGFLSPLNIGQMIEFLEDKDTEAKCQWIDNTFKRIITYSEDLQIGWNNKDELCDELWEVCKLKLKQ